MKFITVVLLALTFSTSFAGNAGGDKNTGSGLSEKYYEINKWGYAQFTYWKITDQKDIKFGAKPISDKTLYIETSRQGIIDADLTWKEFQQLSVEDWKLMLIEGQPEVIAAMETQNNGSKARKKSRVRF